MSDDDLIRRGDALAVLDEYVGWGDDTIAAIRALPATDAREAVLDALASLDMARDKLTALIDKPAPDARDARQAAARLLLDMLHMKNGAHEGVTKEDAQAMWEAASTREGYAAVDAFLRSIIGEART